MTEQSDRPLGESEELIAYLDGELEPAAARELEERLLLDGSLRSRLSEYQRSWDMLDELPRAEAGSAFVRSTIETVAASSSQLAQPPKVTKTNGAKWPYVWLAAAVVGSFITGYLITQRTVVVPAEQLVKDQPLIEQLDTYRHAESVDFLRSLADQDLFALEEGDVL